MFPRLPTQALAGHESVFFSALLLPCLDAHLRPEQGPGMVPPLALHSGTKAGCHGVGQTLLSSSQQTC